MDGMMPLSYDFPNYGPSDAVPFCVVRDDDNSEWGRWAKARNAHGMRCLKKHGRTTGKSNEDWAKELGL